MVLLIVANEFILYHNVPVQVANDVFASGLENLGKIQLLILKITVIMMTWTASQMDLTIYSIGILDLLQVIIWPILPIQKNLEIG